MTNLFHLFNTQFKSAELIYLFWYLLRSPKYLNHFQDRIRASLFKTIGKLFRRCCRLLHNLTSSDFNYLQLPSLLGLTNMDPLKAAGNALRCYLRLIYSLHVRKGHSVQLSYPPTSQPPASQSGSDSIYSKHYSFKFTWLWWMNMN